MPDADVEGIGVWRFIADVERVKGIRRRSKWLTANV